MIDQSYSDSRSHEVWAARRVGLRRYAASELVSGRVFEVEVVETSAGEAFASVIAGVPASEREAARARVAAKREHRYRRDRGRA